MQRGSTLLPTTGNGPFPHIRRKMTLTFSWAPFRFVCTRNRVRPYSITSWIGRRFILHYEGACDRHATTGWVWHTALCYSFFFESEMDYDDPMILFDEEEKFNKLQAACSFLRGETARMAKVRSASKEFTLFDIQNNHQVAPSGPPRIEQDICYSPR